MINFKMPPQFKKIESNEVITITEENVEYRIVLSHPTFRVNEFTEATIRPFSNGVVANRSRYPSNLPDKWFQTGIDCEILKPGAKGWQKGKVRIRVYLEFCPDEPEIEETVVNNQPEISEPESPLDDLRQLLKLDN